MLRARSKVTLILMRRSIPHECVARRLNSSLFALLASCHASASIPENVNLFFFSERLDTGKIAAKPALLNRLLCLAWREFNGVWMQRNTFYEPVKHFPCN